MAGKGVPDLRRVAENNAAAGTNKLRTDKVSPGWIEHIKFVAVENETTAYTRLRIGIETQGVFYPFLEEKTPNAAALYFTDVDWILREGQNLQAELTGCTSGDNLEFYIYGLKERV